MIAKGRGRPARDTNDSGAVQPEVESLFQVLRKAVEEYGFAKDTSFSAMKDLHELKTDVVLHQNMNLLQTDFPYSIRSAQTRACFAHALFCKEDTKDAVRLMSVVMVLEAHDHRFCSAVRFFH